MLQLIIMLVEEHHYIWEKFSHKPQLSLQKGHIILQNLLQFFSFEFSTNLQFCSIFSRAYFLYFQNKISDHFSLNLSFFERRPFEIVISGKGGPIHCNSLLTIMIVKIVFYLGFLENFSCKLPRKNSTRLSMKLRSFNENSCYRNIHVYDSWVHFCRIYHWNQLVL